MQFPMDPKWQERYDKLSFWEKYDVLIMFFLGLGGLIVYVTPYKAFSLFFVIPLAIWFGIGYYKEHIKNRR